MAVGFSILHKPATKRTDNTLITILGKPTICDNWQDNLTNIIARQLHSQIPNNYTLRIVNNETPLIERLRSIGLLTAIGTGSLQNLNGCGISQKAQAIAQTQNKEPLDYVCSFLNQGLMRGLCNAEPFFDKAISRIKNQVSPVFEFDKDAQSIVKWLFDISKDIIYQAMKPYEIATGNYIVWKNAIVAKGYINTPFKDLNYNNIVLIDSSHCDDSYMEQWSYLEPNDFVDFEVVASPNGSTPLATTEMLASLIQQYANNTFELYCM